MDKFFALRNNKLCISREIEPRRTRRTRRNSTLRVLRALRGSKKNSKIFSIFGNQWFGLVDKLGKK